MIDDRTNHYKKCVITVAGVIRQGTNQRNLEIFIAHNRFLFYLTMNPNRNFVRLMLVLFLIGFCKFTEGEECVQRLLGK